MTVALLAVHPQVRSLVLPNKALELGVDIEIRDPGETPWTEGWPADSSVEVVITGWGTPPITDDTLARLPALRSILHIGGSVRDLVATDVWSRGIQVVSAAEANNTAVAEFVTAATLLAFKGTFRAAEMMRRQGRLPGPFGGRGSVGQTVGLVSYGSIARKVRERLRTFDAIVLAWDPFVADQVFIDAGVEPVSNLDDLFRRSMLVSVHAPLITGQTENLITGAHLNLMQSGATFVNTARGALVDEPSMVQTLRDRPDLLAILDVTWPEPPPADSALFDLPNVLLTGHTAGSVGTESFRMGTYIAAKLRDIADGKPLTEVISRDGASLRA